MTMAKAVPGIHDQQPLVPRPLSNLTSPFQVTGDQDPLWPNQFCSIDVSRRPALAPGLCRSRGETGIGLLTIRAELCPQPGGSSLFT